MQRITATSYDSREDLLSKYPTVQSTLDQILGVQPVNSKRTDSKESERSGEDEAEEEWEGFSSTTSESGAPDDDLFENGPSDENPSQAKTSSILHGIDACKLSQSKDIRSRGPYDKIVFNFPHVGGVSKDVNRQVRLNQELLVGFFKSCKSLLASQRRPAPQPITSEYYDTDEDVEDDEASDESRPSSGQVLLSVFESEPYTLWNVRDLGRHSGYKIIETFRFPWEAYSGYKHARTIGDIQGKQREDGKRSGAWRGEEREARMYVFELNESEPGKNGNEKKVVAPIKKRQQNDSDDSD